ncbi:DUF2586 domain-containing protein [Pasteurella multocida]
MSTKIPSVAVHALNLKSGTVNEIERTALFLGVGKNPGRLTAVSADSDLDKLFGNSELKKQLQAAKIAAGQNWLAYVYELSDENYQASDVKEAVLAANKQISPEYVVNTRTLVSRDDITALQALHLELLAKYGRRQFFIQAIKGIDSSNENWTTYLNELNTLSKNIVADHVMLVPQLMGNDAGELAGRLANRAVTIADTPARVKTGALVGIERNEVPKDNENTPLDLAHIQTLASYRYSTIMWYPDYDGFYWTKGLTLDTEGGDYQYIENVRVVDKVARRIRLKAIAKIGDRSFNSTSASTEVHKTYFASVIREMSTATTIGTEHFPGECFPPKEDSVVIQWVNKETVRIYIKVRPIDCPTDITASILLDLTSLGDE